MESLPELTTGWFREQGVSDPEAVASAWAAWLAMPSKKRTRQTQIRKAMEFASGLSRAAIDHYFHQSTREGKLSASTLHRLNDLCAALGEPLPSASKGPAPSSRSRQPERIAVFLDLHEPPSPRFHVECLESVFAAARSYNFAVTLHQLNTKDPDQRSQVAQVVRSARPDGVVWFRITPTRDSLHLLRRQSPPTPVAIIYAARLQYQCENVLAHIMPFQAGIRSEIAQWARSLPLAGRGGRVVLAHMPREFEGSDIPPFSDQIASIRNERIDLIRDGIADASLATQLWEVPDYSASHAFDLVGRFKDALGWVCLSDELAVGVLQQLEARGLPTGREQVMGFDDSALARKHGITSFTQHLPEIGEHLAATFASFFRNSQRTPDEWPQFTEKHIRVTLVKALTSPLDTREAVALSGSETVISEDTRH